MPEENAIPQAEQTETPAVETQTEQDTTPQTIKVKFNHEELELPIDEAVKHIQKGMNYDKIHDQLEGLRNSKALKIAEKIAKQYNVTPDELLEKWERDIEDQRAEELAKEQDMPVEAAKEVLEARRLKEAAESEQAKKARMAREEAAFWEAYPDTKNEDISDEVLAEWADGKPLIQAFEAEQGRKLTAKVKQLEEVIKAKEKNQENSQSSMGSVASKGEALPLEINEKTVKEKDSAWRRANMDAILAAIKTGKLKAT